MTTALKSECRIVIEESVLVLSQEWQVEPPLISYVLIEKITGLRWYTDSSESWWSGLSPFLVLSLPPTESSKQQDVTRTRDALHAGLHALALSKLETFKVDRTLPSIIDWNTAHDTTWTHTILLTTLLGKNHPVVSALMHFKSAHYFNKSHYVSTNVRNIFL